MSSRYTAMRTALSLSASLHLVLFATPPRKPDLPQVPQVHDTSPPAAEFALFALAEPMSAPSAETQGNAPSEPEPASATEVPIEALPVPGISPKRGAAESRKPEPPRRRAPPAPKPACSEAAPVVAAISGSSGLDSGAIMRTLERIANTPELTRPRRRAAMLVVLRTWEDPSRTRAAEQLIDLLLVGSPN